MGAWIETFINDRLTFVENVAPYVGAWIETTNWGDENATPMSHPTWVRGLKLKKEKTATARQVVAPYVGAWIETQKNTG